MTTGNGRDAFWLATAAVGWSLAFIGLALFAPSYGSGATLLEADPETLVRVAVATPLVLSSAVWLLLHAACRFDAVWAQRAGAAGAWLLVGFAVIAGFSIGLFVVPVAIALVLAVARTPVARR